MSISSRIMSAQAMRSALAIKSACPPAHTLNLFHASMTTAAKSGGRTSKLQQLLSKKNIAQAAKTMKAPTLQSPTSALPSDKASTGEVSIKPIPAAPLPPGQWGIQMVLSYLRTQKISKCVVFDSYSQNTMNNYIIVCNVPSVRAMYSLAERLVKQARMYRPAHYDQFAAGCDADGLWSVADMGSVLVHILTDAGRASPAFQRVERRLLNEAKLVPVTMWGQLKDAWVEREERLIANPPPEYKYKDKSLPPPGYYARPYRPAVINRNYEPSDSEGEFGYYDLDEHHKLKVEAMRSGAVGVDSVWSQDAIEFVDVENKYQGEEDTKTSARPDIGGQKRVARVDEDDEDDAEEDEDEYTTASESEYYTEDEDEDGEEDEDTSSEEVEIVRSANTTTAARETGSLGLYDDLACSDEEAFDITMEDHENMLDSEDVDVIDEEEEEAMVFNYQKKGRGMTVDDVEMRLSQYVDGIDKHEEEALGRLLKDEDVTVEESESEEVLEREAKLSQRK